MLVTQVQWTANSTMNIMRRRMTMEPMLVELARSLIWWAGSTEGTWEEAPLDCCFYQCVCVCMCVYGGEPELYFHPDDE